MSTAPAPTHRSSAPGRFRSALPVIAVLLLAAILAMLVVDRIFFTSSSRPAGTGSGVASTQARSVPPFTGVDLAGANNVIVRVGARRSVVVHADSNLLSRVTTRVRSGRLVIDTTPGSLSTKSPMYVVVAAPSLDAVTLQGEGNISVSGIDSRRLTVRLPGSGVIRAAGKTTRLDVTLGGSGTALLGELAAQDVNAGLSGDGTIVLRATHRLDASLPGSGTIVYAGNPPHVTTKVTGDGTIAPG